MATTFDLIATNTIASPTSSLTFSSIPSTYTDLRLISNFGTTSGYGCNIYINNATSGYYALQTYSDGSALSGTEIGAISYGPFCYYTGRALSSGGISPVVDFYGYRGGQNKGYFYYSNMSSGISEAFGVTTNAVGGPITSIVISTGSNIEAGSVFSLYGILRA